MSGRRFPDLWLDPAEDPRITGVRVEGERDTLLDFLRTQRLTFELKCEGLTPAQLAERSVPPSDLSLLGLLRHLAGVEHHWFRQALGGSEDPRPYRTAEDRDADFHGAAGDPAVVEDAWLQWRSAVADADVVVAGLADLAEWFSAGDDEELSVRQVLVHLVEEYGRHNGHADLLRERIDGRTGE